MAANKPPSGNQPLYINQNQFVAANGANGAQRQQVTT